MSGAIGEAFKGNSALDFSGLAPPIDVSLIAPTNGADLTIPCFASGTRIATPDGDVAVETLREGDLLLTASGEVKAVVWVGHSRIDCRRHARPEEVVPIRVRASAFAPGIPERDLVLSPGHAVWAEAVPESDPAASLGVLVPVGRLVNGISIVREEDAAEVTYYHVELPTHDLVLAEKLRVESYLDDGNRAAFANGAARDVLHPELEPKNRENTCLPFRDSGAEVSALKRRLRARLEQWGYRHATESRVELLVGGKRLKPRFARGGLRHFRLPAGVNRVVIASPPGVPAGFIDDSADGRWLGAQLAIVLLDGELIALDSPMLGEGFYGVEQDASGRWRWTNGRATLHLPPSSEPRLLELYVRDTMQHWQAPQQPLSQAA